MSRSIQRPRSSKQGLQNLTRVTAQRSREDAEEIERERRRRAREKQRGQGSPSSPMTPGQGNASFSRGAVWSHELKPCCQLVQEEDEGFSDWTHKLDGCKRAPEEKQQVQDDDRTREKRCSEPRWKSGPEEEQQEEQQEEHQEEQQEEQQEEEQEEHQEEEQGGARRTDMSPETPTRHPEDKMCNMRKEVRISYSCTVFMPQDGGVWYTNSQAARRTAGSSAAKPEPRLSVSPAHHREELDEEEPEVFLGSEKKEEEIHRERQELQLNDLKLKTEQVQQGMMGNLHFKMEDRPKVMEEEYSHFPEETRRLKTPEHRERRREEAAQERRTTPSISADEQEGSLNTYGPMSPTFKKLLIQFYPNEMQARVTADSTCTITERTESLGRSLLKSNNSMRKTAPPAAVSRIDSRLEQYTHATKSFSTEAKPVKQMFTDLPGPSEPVAMKRNLFEAGDAWSQTSTVVTPAKDADALKVGVADLISQWVKGSSDGSRSSSPSKPAEIKAGDVLSKKNLWENLVDTSSPGREGRGSSCGQRYKFVVTGHGKYEKVYVDDDGYSEYTDYPPAGIVKETLDI